jgi:anti-sigma B factor antagonist
MSLSQPRGLLSTPRPAIPDFRIEAHPHRELVVVEVSGELCLATASRVHERIQELVASGFAHVVLDLRKVAFMDSTGVRLLVEAEAMASADGFRFAIMIDKGQPSRVLDLVGMPDRPRRVGPGDLPA